MHRLEDLQMDKLLGYRPKLFSLALRNSIRASSAHHRSRHQFGIHPSNGNEFRLVRHLSDHHVYSILLPSTPKRSCRLFERLDKIGRGALLLMPGKEVPSSPVCHVFPNGSCLYHFPRRASLQEPPSLFPHLPLPSHPRCADSAGHGGLSCDHDCTWLDFDHTERRPANLLVLPFRLRHIQLESGSFPML